MASLAHDSVGILALRILLYATTFATGVIVSRALGPEGRGDYYLPFLGATTLVTVAKLGLDQGAVFLFGERGYRLGTLWRLSRLASWLLGSIAAVVLLASPWLLPSTYAAASLALLGLAALTIPLQMLTLYGGALLTLAGQATAQFRAGVVAVLTQAVLLVALWGATGLTPGLVLVAGLVGAGVGAAMIAWRCRDFDTQPLPASWVRDVLAASLPLHVSSMLLWLHLRLDMFMVSAFAGAAALGLYSLAVMLAETVQLATDSVGTALLARQASGAIGDAARLGLVGARVNTIVGGTIALGWVLVAPIFVPFVFGQSFRDAVLPLIVLLPAMLALGWQRACAAAIVRAGRPWRIVVIHASSLALNAVLNVWWIPRFGSSGASAASAVSYAASAAAMLAWNLSLAGGRARDAVPGASDLRLVWSGLNRVLRPWRTSASDGTPTVDERHDV